MLTLAWPLVLAEIGWMAMAIVDTIMVGHMPNSAEAIGGVSLGGVMFYSVGIFGGSLLFSLWTHEALFRGGEGVLPFLAHRLVPAARIRASLPVRGEGRTPGSNLRGWRNSPAFG